jgi:hypothetical protein
VRKKYCTTPHKPRISSAVVALWQEWMCYDSRDASARCCLLSSAPLRPHIVDASDPSPLASSPEPRTQRLGQHGTGEATRLQFKRKPFTPMRNSVRPRRGHADGQQPIHQGRREQWTWTTRLGRLVGTTELPNRPRLIPDQVHSFFREISKFV